MESAMLLDASLVSDVANIGRNDALTRWSGHSYRGHMPQRRAQPQRPTAWMRYLQEIQDRPGWSIARVARESNGQISRSAIFRMMSGDTRRVSVNVVRLIAAIVGDDPDEVMKKAGGSIVGAPTTDPRLEGLDPNDDVVRHILSLDIDEEERGFMLDRRRQLLALRREQDMRELELLAKKSARPE